ncbi:MAG: hypothetical protein H6744_07900 [Deltaproteobacteria bacterium]|nr:hypothetical protein [Deltaproteobacteria bacterium]MCB9786603.1 hypothetical protein [Deltaproteobacteria bacterium]
MATLVGAAACQRKDAEPATAAPAQAGAAPESAAAEDEAPSPMQKALAAAGRPVTRAATQVSPEQLAVTQARSGELLDVTGTPLRVGLLRYESPAVAAKALQQVVLWINGSGLLHNGEATARGDTVIVVGTIADETPTDETRALFDRYIDAFLEAK